VGGGKTAGGPHSDAQYLDQIRTEHTTVFPARQRQRQRRRQQHDGGQCFWQLRKVSHEGRTHPLPFGYRY